MGIFAFLSKNTYSQPLDWLQVEISTHCQASCLYCPHTVYRDQWHARFMPMSVFSQLGHLFAQTRMVHLQGWGEPLLHPDFTAMLAQVKKAGCMASITTNGLALTEDLMHHLVDAQLDSLAFSLAGATAEENDQVRRGTSFERVFEAIRLLERIKQEKQSALPEVRIAYLLLRSHLPSLEKLISGLVKAGIRECTLSPLSLVCSPELESETIAPLRTEDGKTIKALRRRLFSLSVASAFQGLNLHTHTLVPKHQRWCSENIRRALVVDVTGKLMPCVFGSLPVKGEVTHVFRGRQLPFVARTFAAASETDLQKFRRSDPYQQFLREYPEGGHCPVCWKRYVVTD